MHDIVASNLLRRVMYYIAQHTTFRCYLYEFNKFVVTVTNCGYSVGSSEGTLAYMRRVRVLDSEP